MKLNKQMLAAVLVTTVSAGSIIGINTAAAQSSDNRRTQRATQLAEKLGVEVSAVESAFEELHAEKQAEREAKRAEHIAGLVSAGTITQEQADELVALKEGFKAEIEALRESGADRDSLKAAREENRAEFKAWAEKQGIDLDEIRPEDGYGKGRRGHSNMHGDETLDKSE